MSATKVIQAPPTATREKGCCQVLAPRVPVATVTAAATVLRALADPTRLQMLHMIAAASEPVCVCDFTAALDLGQPTISHHLGKLRAAGVLTSSKKGIWTFYRLASPLPPTAAAALAALAP